MAEKSLGNLCEHWSMPSDSLEICKDAFTQLVSRESIAFHFARRFTKWLPMNGKYSNKGKLTEPLESTPWFISRNRSLFHPYRTSCLQITFYLDVGGLCVGLELRPQGYTNHSFVRQNIYWASSVCQILTCAVMSFMMQISGTPIFIARTHYTMFSKNIYNRHKHTIIQINSQCVYNLLLIYPV